MTAGPYLRRLKQLLQYDQQKEYKDKGDADALHIKHDGRSCKTR